MLHEKLGSPLGGRQCNKTQGSQRSGEGRIYYSQQVWRTLGIVFKAMYRQQRRGNFKVTCICIFMKGLEQRGIQHRIETKVDNSPSFSWLKSWRSGKVKCIIPQVPVDLVVEVSGKSLPLNTLIYYLYYCCFSCLITVLHSFISLRLLITGTSLVVQWLRVWTRGPRFSSWQGN